MKDEGVIKFNGLWKQEPPMPYQLIAALNEWRNKLYLTGLIGADENGIGYGNVSCRIDACNFAITGSGTGALKQLGAEHYTIVTGYDLVNNSLVAEGPVKASSESLTHAAIYETVPEVNVVFHIHHATVWQNLLATLPSTDKKVAYGTTAMAKEITRLLNKPQVLQAGILAMGGHKDGIISFGATPHAAGRPIDEWLSRL